MAALSLGAKREPRGVYALDDEVAPWLRDRLVFPSKDECLAWMKEHIHDKEHPSNPDEPHLTQIFTMLVSWKQVESYLLPKIDEYDKRYPPRTPPLDRPFRPDNIWMGGTPPGGGGGGAGAGAGAGGAAVDKDEGDDETPKPDPVPRSMVLGVDRGLRERLDLPFHRMLNRESTRNTLKYMFEHMRCGIYVMIRHGKMRMFVPFVNAEYENNWSEKLYWTVGDEMSTDVQAYYTEKQSRSREENVCPKVSDWWANGNIICNEHCQPGEAQSQYWGDQFISPLRDMLHQTCQERDVPDCEFFINKRDYPHLKHNKDAGCPVEPYGFIYDKDDRDPSQDVPLTRQHHPTYAPIASFYCGHADRFADLPLPSSEDWEAATGLIFPPSFKLENNGKLKNPRDLFTEENFRKFERPWEEKDATCLFRGTATGGGVTAATNQRINAAALSHLWKSDSRYNGSDGGAPFLDAAITGWNMRDKKIAGHPMTHLKKEEFPFEGGKQNFIPIYEQSRYKYLLYVDGHCAACRYAFMMRLGSVILKVESAQVADQMWYFPLLRPWVDHVPIAADLSDLADKIRWCREHDDECRRIAQRAMQIYDTYVSEQGVLDYMELLCHRVAERWRYPASWWSAPPPIAPPPKSAGRVDPQAPCYKGRNDDGSEIEKQCVRCREELAAATRKRSREAAEGGGGMGGLGESGKAAAAQASEKAAEKKRLMRERMKKQVKRG